MSEEMMDFSDVDSTFGETQAAEAGGDLPKGQYEMIVVSCKASLSKGDVPKRRWTMKCRVRSPENYAGRTHFIGYTVEPDEKYLQWLKKDLKILEIDESMESLNDLTDGGFILEHVVGIVFQCGITHKKNKGDDSVFVNTHINTRVGREDITDDSIESAPPEDDEARF